MYIHVCIYIYYVPLLMPCSPVRDTQTKPNSLSQGGDNVCISGKEETADVIQSWSDVIQMGWIDLYTLSNISCGYRWV